LIAADRQTQSVINNSSWERIRIARAGRNIFVFFVSASRRFPPNVTRSRAVSASSTFVPFSLSLPSFLPSFLSLYLSSLSSSPLSPDAASMASPQLSTEQESTMLSPFLLFLYSNFLLRGICAPLPLSLSL
jgi:hypothetical protein